MPRPITKPKKAATPPPPTPGELCRAQRARIGLSQTQLAARTGVAQSQLAALETDGRGQPGEIGRMLLALALELPLDALLTEAQREATRPIVEHARSSHR